jgi:3',5'-cyclic AMP phosphodiesterase CpdA
MTKRVVTIVIFVISLAVLISLAYFLFVPKQAKTIENSPAANSLSAPKIKSFRGVLADVLKDAEEKVEEVKKEITEVIPNPFVPKTENPAPNPDNSLTFAILGDTQYFTPGNSKGNFQKAVAQITKQNPDLVLQMGDLIRGCEGKSEDARDYANWKNTLGVLASKTYAVQGNHDRVDNVDKCDRFWTDTFSFPTNGPEGFAEFAYSLDLKNSHLVFLDSNKPDAHQINSTQRDWLEKDLAANKKENIFVVFHEPAYPVSDKAKESLDVDPSQRNALWEILDRHNVTAVFSGHEHIVSRRKITSQVSSVAKNSIYQFVFGNTDSFDHVLPAAGVAEYANQGQGRYGLVKVNGKEITVEVYDPNGKLLNSFTFSK